jgi:NCS2 family nucleobase:cation symporter-2/xanthine permease XanP
MSSHHRVRFEPNDPISHGLAARFGAETTILILTGTVITPLVVARAAGLDAASTSWLVFAALLASGFATWLQIRRIGIIGSGYAFAVSSSAAFISVSVSALKAGGIPLLATLVAFSSLVAYLFTVRMGDLRKILTPAVCGIILILTALSIAPVAWEMLHKVPTGPAGQPYAAIVVLATLTPIVILSLFGGRQLRLWAPLVGILFGCAVAWHYQLIEFAPVAQAAWIGLPEATWAGMDLQFGESFWTLLPGFLLIMLVGCIETYAEGIDVQRASHRRPSPIDFRAVQGGINASGLGNLFAGLLGTLPNNVDSASVDIIESTGVASRRVAFWGGLLLMTLAFSPKLVSVFAVIPSPVAGVYILMVLVLLFGHGLHLVKQEELTAEVTFAVCLGFWIGTGFQGGHLFNELFPQWMQKFLSKGSASGGLIAVLIMIIFAFRQRSRDRLSLPLMLESIGLIKAVIDRFGKRIGWDQRARNSLLLAAEEGFLFLLENQGPMNDKEGDAQLHVRLRRVGDEVEIEYATAPASLNAEAALSTLSDMGEPEDDSEISLRLLRGIAKKVNHLQYHGTDYLLIRVDTAA